MIIKDTNRFVVGASFVIIIPTVVTALLFVSLLTLSLCLLRTVLRCADVDKTSGIGQS